MAANGVQISGLDAALFRLQRPRISRALAVAVDDIIPDVEVAIAREVVRVYNVKDIYEVLKFKKRVRVTGSARRTRRAAKEGVMWLWKPRSLAKFTPVVTRYFAYGIGTGKFTINRTKRKRIIKPHGYERLSVTIRRGRKRQLRNKTGAYWKPAGFNKWHDIQNPEGGGTNPGLTFYGAAYTRRGADTWKINPSVRGKVDQLYGLSVSQMVARVVRNTGAITDVINNASAKLGEQWLRNL